LPPWRWPRVWPKRVADHYVYNCLIYLRVLLIKPTRFTNFSNLFCHEIPHVSDSSSIHHQDGTRSILMMYKPVWRIPLLCVQWKTPDDGQRNCP
jgi:hypothetical protein